MLGLEIHPADTSPSFFPSLAAWSVPSWGTHAGMAVSAPGALIREAVGPTIPFTGPCLFLVSSPDPISPLCLLSRMLHSDHLCQNLSSGEGGVQPWARSPNLHVECQRQSLALSPPLSDYLFPLALCPTSAGLPKLGRMETRQRSCCFSLYGSCFR